MFSARGKRRAHSPLQKINDTPTGLLTRQPIYCAPFFLVCVPDLLLCEVFAEKVPETLYFLKSKELFSMSNLAQQ